MICASAEATGTSNANGEIRVSSLFDYYC